MKLIIDIPDTAYEAYKEWHKQGVSNVEQSLIAFAMPYEERPHGKWLEWVDEKWGGTTVYCSVCKLKALRSSSNDFVMSNFCPQCGADMRGEIDHGAEE